MNELGAYLFDLLASHGPYRRRWERELGTRRGPGVSRAAVTRVLAAHLVEAGERSIYEEGIDRRLKDRVGRAAQGRVSAETLRWFVAAFEMDEDHVSRLWDRFAAGDPGATGPAARSVVVHELRQLGADGRPAWQRSVQVLRAAGDGVRSHTVELDAPATVEVVRGGRSGPAGPDPLTGLWRAEIDLGRTLAAGETASLEYVARFTGWARLPVAGLRRACPERVDALELRVQWHPDRLPDAVHWVEWDGPDPGEAGSGSSQGAERSRRAVALEPDHSVHGFLQQVERRTVGFTWEWPGA